MKRISSLFITLCVGISMLLCFSACGDGLSEGDTVGLSYEEVGEHYRVVGIGDAKDEKIVIPAFYKGKPVTEIGEHAFGFTEDFGLDYQITSVTLSTEITKIGEFAFNGCAVLKEVIMSKGVIEIGNGAFASCIRLEKIVIPESVIQIGNSAFAYCEILSEIILPSTITMIDKGAFNGCSSLRSIEIPEGVTKLSGIFSDCTKLNSIILPKSLTVIALNEFSNCSNLKDVYYSGTEEEWDKISGLSNRFLMNATIHFAN